MIKKITISGFRGFAEEQEIDFALPNNNYAGSGLTVITGANNSGKTTIIEAISAFNGDNTPNFSEGRRNKQSCARVLLQIMNEKEEAASIKTVPSGGSATHREGISQSNYILQARRYVPFEFGGNCYGRETYIAQNQRLLSQRTPTLSGFEARLSEIVRNKDKSKFDILLKGLLGQGLEWTIDQRDSGQFYVKYTKDNNVSHSGEGVGDGIWSIFTICVALYDAKEGTTIVIDEPELSIHPALQRKLMQIILEYSKTRQIIISTHSPYFIPWQSICNGVKLIRVVNEEGCTKCYSISEKYRKKLVGVTRDLHNVHVLDIVAREALFLEDKIILVEGQEDVVFFKKIEEQLNMRFEGEFYGYGVGGADKMGLFLQLFKDLGYHHVVAILDGDKQEKATELRAEFEKTGYQILVLPTDDIRDKPESKNKEGKIGMVTEKGKLKPKYEVEAKKIISEVNEYFLQEVR